MTVEVKVLKRFPWLSVGLLIIVYVTFGWHTSLAAIPWSHQLTEYGKQWGWLFTDELLFLLLHIFAGIAIMLVTIALTAPVAILSIFLGPWFKSNIRAVISILVWSFALVLMLSWLEYSIHFLLLISSAILVRLGFQQLGYNHWKIFIVLFILCVSSFVLGVFLFERYGHQPISQERLEQSNPVPHSPSTPKKEFPY